MSMRAGLATVALLLGAAGTARAQRIEGALTAQSVTYRFADFGGVGQMSGTYMGGSVTLGLGAVRIGARGVFGQLTDPTNSVPQRDVRVTGLWASTSIAPWLEAGVEARARRAIQDPDTTVVRLAGPFARARIGFGSGLAGTAELAYYPFNDVVNLDPVDLALQAGVGVRYEPAGAPVSFYAGYRLFRIDYRSTGLNSRLEQDQSIVFELTVHGGR